MCETIEETREFQPRWNADGLMPCIAQDVETGDVLMMAWVNDHVLRLSLETREAHYWSRSRSEIWHKGASSGAIQEIEDILIDCDQDCLIYKVRVKKRSDTCHTGREDCFYRRMKMADGTIVLSVKTEINA